MKILFAGSGGMVGSAVIRHSIECGHEVIRLVRQTPGPGEVWWNPDAGEIDAAGLEGFDGVVHLATMRWPPQWTDEAKQQIRANRLTTNGLLAKTVANCTRKPGVLVCASGMGFYPSSGDDIITEECACGTSWLATLQRDGEAATIPAGAAGIRVVNLRIPPVVARNSIEQGANVIGSGRQWVSWIARDELASIIEHVLVCDAVTGPVNPVSPNPLRNADYAATVARVLGREPGGPVPEGILLSMLGEMGEEFVLASRRMQPAKLLATGYRFRFPELEQALRHEMGRLDAG